MPTATTDNGQSDGVMFYDGECSMCVRGALRFGPLLKRRRIELARLQAPDTCARIGVAEEDRLKEMRLRLGDGTVFGGAAAVIEVARRIWWARPLWALSRLPGAMRLMRAAYGWVARHRGCASDACRLDAPVSRHGAGALPLVVLPAIAVLVRRSPPWAFIWTMAGGALRRMQMAVVSRRAQPRRPRTSRARARVSPRVAGHGERSTRGRRLGLGHGWRGRLFAVLVAAGPAYWLFPPPFVHRVILPMLAAIGAR